MGAGSNTSSHTVKQERRVHSEILQQLLDGFLGYLCRHHGPQRVNLYSFGRPQHVYICYF